LGRSTLYASFRLARNHSFSPGNADTIPDEREWLPFFAIKKSLHQLQMQAELNNNLLRRFQKHLQRLFLCPIAEGILGLHDIVKLGKPVLSLPFLCYHRGRTVTMHPW